MAHRTIERHTNRDQTKIVTATCRDKAGALADPSTLTATVRTPAGVPTTYTYGVDSAWARTSLGIFTFTVTPNVDSVTPWEVRILSTMTDGTKAAAIAEIYVEEDNFA